MTQEIVSDAELVRILSAYQAMSKHEHSLDSLSKQAAIKELVALRAKMREREGWKLVPVQPTREMIEAGRAAHLETENNKAFALRGHIAAHHYRAMLAAVPVLAPDKSAGEI